ncbi:M1 family metallopeptidase [Rufibacter sp. LB8]|uniref:M1 family metallopeptidase n=1 Tax=Rufibacter sp. LB8 TaxID=2777781 RepID=UPI00178C791D|nr:M1 family metallopeptidase [Rufibacter sp. LB8]
MNFTKDPHSHACPIEAVITHVDWLLTVDFEEKKIAGRGSYQIQHQNASEIILDVKGLVIEKVELEPQSSTPVFWLSEPDSILGQGLHIPLEAQTKRVHISFSSTQDSAALQWLSPEQTAGKTDPFLFTQSQAILARTWLPCQDSPGIRFTYTAKVTVPTHLLPLMSAQNPQEKNSSGTYHFIMERPMPSYLLSLAVGDLQFKPLGERCGVYAEPSIIEAAAQEFLDTENMLEAAETLYGPYLWGRYDLLVLPPSFPFGGMENPMLTFATPTIITGDKSLTSLVAHELAHSWSGNLVTNATWNDFWLNEGFTVYFERRIMEALYGEDYAHMLHVLGYHDLLQTLEELKHTPEDTHLKLQLENRDPDEGLTEIAYEKGNLFLCHLEALLGRVRFDAFVTQYFNTYQFKCIDTASFVSILENELINGNSALRDQINYEAFIFQPGIPAGVAVPSSQRFHQVETQVQLWQQGTAPAELETEAWSTHEILYFLKKMPNTLSTAQLQELDAAFGFTASTNAEIQAAWLQLAIAHQYAPAFPALQAFLLRVGRRKFVLPLYKALLATEAGTQMAREIYQQAKPGYHAVTFSSVDALLAKS